MGIWTAYQPIDWKICIFATIYKPLRFVIPSYVTCRLIAVYYIITQYSILKTAACKHVLVTKTTSMNF